MAYATLMRGSGFLGFGMRADAETIAGPGRAKVIGNGLRELDRFLGLLADEAAVILAPPDFDRPDFVRRRNVANKICIVDALTGRASPERDRLRAIGRVRDCLHHCRGVVHDGAVREDLRVASGSSEIGNRDARLAVSFDDLREICRFYTVVAGRIMDACRQHRRPD